MSQKCGNEEEDTLEMPEKVFTPQFEKFVQKPSLESVYVPLHSSHRSTIWYNSAEKFLKINILVWFIAMYSNIF